MSHQRVVWLAVSWFLLFAAPSFAGNVPKGALIVRDGAANTDANYANQDKDPNGRLQQVSALCSAGAEQRDRANAQSLIGTDDTRTWAATYGTAQVSTIINLDGKVVTDPLTNNPYHCLISGLTVPKMKGVWQMCSAAAC
jgi:hypothetical protein